MGVGFVVGSRCIVDAFVNSRLRLTNSATLLHFGHNNSLVDDSGMMNDAAVAVVDLEEVKPSPHQTLSRVFESWSMGAICSLHCHQTLVMLKFGNLLFGR